MRADGLIAIAYHDNRDDQDPGWTGQVGTGDGTEVDHWKIKVQTRPPTAMSYGGAATLGKAGEANRHPALAFAVDGALLAVWDGMVASPSGQSRSIRHSLSLDGGATFSSPDDPATLAADARRP